MVLEVERVNVPVGALVQQVLRLQTLNASQTRLLLNCLHFFLKDFQLWGEENQDDEEVDKEIFKPRQRGAGVFRAERAA